MRVTEFLDRNGINYEIDTHRATYTAQRLAQEEDEKGRYIAKPVIVKADGKLIMCVLPAPNKINMETLRHQIGASRVELADEVELAERFSDCEVGAEPPFGNLYDMETFMDRSLQDDEYIVFQAGSHTEAIRMNMSDWKRLVEPKVLDFAYQVV